MRCCELSLAREQSLRALDTLIGRYPDANVEIAQELAQLPGPVPAGLPSELLERRPDVVAADRRVAAAFYRREEAQAARLPTISLTGTVNSVSSELFVLQDRDNPVWSAGASLLAPLFTGRALKSQVEIRTAEQRQAIADYGRVGARAFGEVENALAAEIAAGRRAEVLARAAAANQEALEIAQSSLRRRLRRPARRSAAAGGRPRLASRRSCACRPTSSCSASIFILLSEAASRCRLPPSPAPSDRRWPGYRPC